jgi:hypothetical protein
MNAERTFTALTDAQAAGLACVVCGLDCRCGSAVSCQWAGRALAGGLSGAFFVGVKVLVSQGGNQFGQVGQPRVATSCRPR